MNDLTYYKGKELRKFLIVSGRNPSTTELLVAAFLQAQEDHIDMIKLLMTLQEVAQFPVVKTSKSAVIKDLGY